MKKSFNCLTYLDFVSPSPSFNIKGSSRLKNLTGGLLSILAFLAIGVISIYFVVLTFGRSNLSIIYNKTFNVKPVLNLSNNPFQIVIYDTQGISIPMDSGIFTVNVTFWNVEKSKNFVPNITNLYFENCKQPKYKKMYEDNEIELQDISENCLDTTSVNLTFHGLMGGTSGQGVSFLNFYINKCVNSTENNFGCKSDDEIYQKLSGASVNIKYVNYYIDPNNEKAGQKFFKVSTIIINTIIYKVQNFKINTVQYHTDIGYVFEENDVQNFFQVENFVETVDYGVKEVFKGNFDRITFSNGEDLEIYRRSYLKLQTLIANIGGVANGIILVAKILTYLFYHDVLNVYLANSVFQFYEEDIEMITKKANKDKAIALSSNSG